MGYLMVYKYWYRMKINVKNFFIAKQIRINVSVKNSFGYVGPCSARLSPLQLPSLKLVLSHLLLYLTGPSRYHTTLVGPHVKELVP